MTRWDWKAGWRALTRGENIAPLLTARPELMVHELTPQSLEESLTWADVVVIGPGLGQQEWGKKALQKVENVRKPMLWDADALNLLAINPDKRHNRVITPHPGEAARDGEVRDGRCPVRHHRCIARTEVYPV